MELRLKEETKIKEYSDAMQKYNHFVFYHKSGLVISTLIIFLQLVSVVNLLFVWQVMSIGTLLFSFVAAYLVADFLGGIAHMYMDNNTDYATLFGPFVAAFHLHHKTPHYKNQHPLKIYFYESGTKIWLVLYLLVLCYCQKAIELSCAVNFFLVCLGLLSSVAEVSHYWCHNSSKEQKLITILQRYRILLPKNHHAYHHTSDNMNYAFLNGMTNPIINKIAGYFYEGYKNNSDKHVLAYKGEQTLNRL